MPQTPHVEKHFTVSEVVRNIVIGMSDGLTVTVKTPIRSAWQTVVVGGLAASAAFLLAKLFS
jgi:hypothetical protein